MKQPLFFSAAIAACVLPAAGCMPSRPADPRAVASSAASEALGGQYVRRNLVSDGAVPAEHVDPNLVNAWGITHRGASPWWVSDNGKGVATVYDDQGVAQFGASPLVVSVTGAGGGSADPTAVVANTGSSFVVASGGASGPASFLFASEDGTLSGWNAAVPPPTAPATRSTTTVVAVDESSPDPLGGAVFKGLTIASTPAGDRLYATDFRGGAVQVFDGTFAPASTSGGFVDPALPVGYAPFGIRAIDGTIYVTYALQDAAKHDDVAGRHHGFVDAFTTDGVLLRRVASGGKLDSPWGLAMAPASGFGRLGGMLLVGNFGDGHIVGYPAGGAGDGDDVGETDEDGSTDDDGVYLAGTGGLVTIDGLWGLDFGNGAAAGPVNALFFAAGPNGEADGLFGRIDFVPGNGG
jgi:uncharacterized protein (TIGR03118 family)